jgi:hypothetical protein
MSYTCQICDKKVDEELRHRGAICFKCHLKGVRIGFTYGKDNFHGDTIGERQRKTVADAAANGIKAEPVGSRWV